MVCAAVVVEDFMKTRTLRSPGAVVSGKITGLIRLGLNSFVRVLGYISVTTLMVIALSYALHAQVTSTFRSPLVLGPQADPMMVTYQGKYFLYVNDSLGYDRLRSSTSMAGLINSESKIVGAPPSGYGIDATVSCYYIFHYNSHWYQYCQDSHGSFALQSASDDPLSGYSLYTNSAGQYWLPMPSNSVWGIAEWPIMVNGQLYMLFTQTKYSSNGQTVDELNEIYAAKASDPITVSGPWGLISQPSQSWECQGYWNRCVNEGGSVLIHGNNVFLLFSASEYDSPSYCVGMLSASITSDLSQPGSWTKHSGCVFSRNDAAGVYGPGSFLTFKSLDGTQDWGVYHVKTENFNDTSGQDRRLEAKQITWDANGNPIFGQPYALQTYNSLPSGDPGQELSAPAVSSWGTDRLTVHAIGQNNAIWERYWSSSAGWSNWQQVGAYPPNGTAAGPVAISRVSNYVDLFIPTDDAIYTETWNGSSWSSWQSEGGPSPVAGSVAGSRAGTATWGGAQLNLYSLGLDHNVWEKYWTSGSGWSAWELGPGAIGVGAIGSPAAYSRLTNYVDLFSGGSDGNLYTDTWNGSSWGGWWNFGSVPTGNASSPALASWGSSNLTLVENGIDGNVYLKYWTSSSGWDANWTNLGAPTGGVVSDPAVYCRVSNYVDVFVRGVNGHIFTNTWNGSTWSGWWDFGEP
jgi:GH43 family beta-xylosidase